MTITKENFGKVVALQADNTQAWDAYVEQHERGSIYHLSKWQALIEKVFGHETYYFFSVDGQGNIDGVLPLVRLRSRLFGDYMVSVPFFNYGGAIAVSAEVEKKLMTHAVSVAEQKKISHIEYRDSIERDTAWEARTDKVVMVLDLPKEEDELWKALGSKRRSQIKRPLRESPEVVHGGIELLDEFYRVFSINMRDLGTPVYSKAFFKAILEQFSEAVTLLIIRLKGKPVGAAFLIQYKGMMEIPWASTLREVNSISINMLMYWEVLKLAINKGCQQFDFGRSSVDSGTYRFKKQWGAEPKQLYWYYWLGEDQELPGLTPNNPKYKLAISMWQKMPVFATQILGPMIVKNLP